MKTIKTFPKNDGVSAFFFSQPVGIFHLVKDLLSTYFFVFHQPWSFTKSWEIHLCSDSRNRCLFYHQISTESTCDLMSEICLMAIEQCFKKKRCDIPTKTGWLIGILVMAYKNPISLGSTIFQAPKLAKLITRKKTSIPWLELPSKCCMYVCIVFTEIIWNYYRQYINIMS